MTPLYERGKWRLMPGPCACDRCNRVMPVVYRTPDDSACCLSCVWATS